MNERPNLNIFFFFFLLLQLVQRTHQKKNNNLCAFDCEVSALFRPFSYSSLSPFCFLAARNIKRRRSKHSVRSFVMKERDLVKFTPINVRFNDTSVKTFLMADRDEFPYCVAHTQTSIRRRNLLSFLIYLIFSQNGKMVERPVCVRLRV